MPDTGCNDCLYHERKRTESQFRRSDFVIELDVGAASDHSHRDHYHAPRGGIQEWFWIGRYRYPHLKYWELQGRNPDGTRNTNFPVLLDVDNLIDYMLLHIYAPAVDWPNRNWWAARRRDTGPAQLDSTGYKFLTWDQEVAADRLDRTTTWIGNVAFERVNQADSPAQIYDRLRNNPEFKQRFADHVQKHLFNDGVLTLTAIRERWAARAAEIDHAMVGESARWGDAWQSPAYKRETHWLIKSNFMQNTYWPSNDVKARTRLRNVGFIQ